jgi:hypothetical protein
LRQRQGQIAQESRAVAGARRCATPALLECIRRHGHPCLMAVASDGSTAHLRPAAIRAANICVDMLRQPLYTRPHSPCGELRRLSVLVRTSSEGAPMPHAYLAPSRVPDLISAPPERSRCLLRRPRLPGGSPVFTGRHIAPVSPVLTETTTWARPQEPWRDGTCHEAPRRVNAVSPRKDAS